VNHLTHMTLICDDGRFGQGDTYDEADAYDDRRFAQEMASPGSSRASYLALSTFAKAHGLRIKRRQRSYSCRRPCCGRPSMVSVYTDMEGVRKVNKPVRACAHCGVAWSVTEGKVITHDLAVSQEDAAWDALLPPVLTPF